MHGQNHIKFVDQLRGSQFLYASLCAVYNL